MAAPHTEAHVEEHSSFIQTPKQLITVIVLAFVVPILVIALLAKLMTTGGRYDAQHPAMSDEAVAARIKPIGQISIGEPPAEPSSPGPAAGDKVAAAPATPKAIYDATCAACHAAGIAGAPKTGDKAAWAPRIQQGMAALYEASLKGKGAMPPKGGNAQLSDEQLKATVDYLVGLAK